MRHSRAIALLCAVLLLLLFALPASALRIQRKTAGAFGTGGVVATGGKVLCEKSDGTDLWLATAATGLVVHSPVITTGIGYTFTGNTVTTGTMFKLVGDDDALNGGLYLDCFGGTSADTSVFKIGEGGIATLKGGATIDNAASATVLNLTETTIRATGILDVTGNSTLASVDVGGGYSGGSGATIAATGNTSINGTLTVDSTTTLTGVATLAAPKFGTVVANTDASETLTEAQTGAIVTCSAAGGATTITLPDPSAASVGVVYYIFQQADQDVIIVPTTADGNSIVAEGVATTDQVTLTHASNKIGVGGWVVGISATKWWVGGFSDTTLTVAVAD
jgi:hypothetical protein